MADDLRDRIIDTLKRNGFGVDDENRVELADAVIQELGLRRDRIDPFVNQLLYGDANSRKHRYVTDWENDD